MIVELVGAIGMALAFGIWFTKWCSEREDPDCTVSSRCCNNK